MLYVLHCATAAPRPLGHALQPEITYGHVFLESCYTVVLRAHPVLLIHTETPAVLLLEEPIKERDGVFRDGVVGGVPFELEKET